MAKEYLTSKNIPFTSFDVSTDKERQKEIVDKTGMFGVPVIFIDEQVILGFDKPKIDQLLGLA
jgi:glutaredoxin